MEKDTWHVVHDGEPEAGSGALDVGEGPADVDEQSPADVEAGRGPAVVDEGPSPSEEDVDVPAWDEPLIEWDEDEEHVASNDEWAYRQADRLVSRIPGRMGKDRKTEGEVFDHQTLMTLHRLLTHGVLRSLDFPVSTGKEANVFRGTTPTGGLVAVKIYRVNTATFKHVLKYIHGDERFEGVAGDKRALVHAWAQKEFRNLHRMREAGVDVPEPIRVLNNVLVTEFLGTGEGAWPKLHDLGRLDRQTAQRFLRKLTDDYVRTHNEAELVHADLSDFNVLVQDAGSDDATPRIIDVGQAVLRTHPMAWEFRARDVRNLAAYFRRQNVDVDERSIQDQLVRSR